MRARTRVSLDDMTKMAALYKQGKTMREIAKQFGRPHSVVHRAVHECGVIARSTGRVSNPSRYALCWQLRKEGHTYAEIAKTIGIKSPGRAHALTLRGRAMERATI